MRRHPRFSLYALYGTLVLSLGGSLGAGLLLAGGNQTNLDYNLRARQPGHMTMPNPG